MELPQSQLALDPCVTKLHDSSTTTVALLDFLAGHLLTKRHHHRAFFELRYGTARSTKGPVRRFRVGLRQ